MTYAAYFDDAGTLIITLACNRVALRGRQSVAFGPLESDADVRARLEALR